MKLAKYDPISASVNIPMSMLNIMNQAKESGWLEHQISEAFLIFMGKYKPSLFHESHTKRDSPHAIFEHLLMSIRALKKFRNVAKP